MRDRGSQPQHVYLRERSGGDVDEIEMKFPPTTNSRGNIHARKFDTSICGIIHTLQHFR